MTNLESKSEEILYDGMDLRSALSNIKEFTANFENGIIGYKRALKFAAKYGNLGEEYKSTLEDFEELDRKYGFLTSNPHLVDVIKLYREKASRIVS